MESRRRLLLRLLHLLLVAAAVTTPVFVFIEPLTSTHLARVAASNGAVAVGAAGLAWWLRRSAAAVVPISRCLVYGLALLISALAANNGEAVHVNVVNFVLVTVLAAVLLGRGGLIRVAPLAATVMVAIAWRQSSAVGGEELLEARLESIAQFLPTYLVIVAVLWLREEPASGSPLTTPSAHSP